MKDLAQELRKRGEKLGDILLKAEAIVGPEGLEQAFEDSVNFLKTSKPLGGNSTSIYKRYALLTAMLFLGLVTSMEAENLFVEANAFRALMSEGLKTA